MRGRPLRLARRLLGEQLPLPVPLGGRGLVVLGAGRDLLGPARLPDPPVQVTDLRTAAQALLEQVAKTGSLELPLSALTEAAAEIRDKIDEQVQASAEVAQVVAALERQYDAFIDAQANRSLLTRDEDLPSGDELGAEFERFLAQQAEKKSEDDDPG